MRPNSAPYTSEQVKHEIDRLRRQSGAIAVVLAVLVVIACVAVFALSTGIIG